MSFLDSVIQSTQQAVDARRRHRSLDELRGSLPPRPEEHVFLRALDEDGMSLIAEFKRKWPSMRRPPSSTDLPTTVREYAAGGARAVSVLTEESNFGGKLADLTLAHESCRLPLLRKDFVVDEYQIYEAAAAGADAVLLIVAVLERAKADLVELHGLARSLHMDALIEVRDVDELEAALAADADIIGINNRDLDKPHDVVLSTTEDLLDASIDASATIVSESGIRQPEQVAGLGLRNVSAVLVGSALMTADDRAAECRRLLGPTLRSPVVASGRVAV